jgi:hypothetical protein
MPSDAEPLDSGQVTNACLHVTPLSQPAEVGQVGVLRSTVTVPVGSGVLLCAGMQRVTIMTYAKAVNSENLLMVFLLVCAIAGLLPAGAAYLKFGGLGSKVASCYKTRTESSETCCCRGTVRNRHLEYTG